MAQHAPAEIEWTLGERIRKVRTTLGLEQDEFGRLFNVTNKAVSQWETDVTVPRRALDFARQVEDIAKMRGLTITAQWLLFGGRSIPCNIPDDDQLELWKNPQQALPGNWGRRASDTPLALVQ